MPCMGCEKLYSVMEAAERLGVGRTMVQVFIDSGRLKTVKCKNHGCGREFIEPEELERFAAIPRRTGVHLQGRRKLKKRGRRAKGRKASMSGAANAEAEPRVIWY